MTPHARERFALASQRIRRHPVAAIAGALLIALVVLVAIWDWNWFKGPLERAVERRTGRTFEIGGRLNVDLGGVVTVSGEQLRFGNAPWAREPLMASAERAEIGIAFWPLLRGDVEIPLVRLDRPRLNLEVGPKRLGNWRFGEEEGGDGPQFRRVHIDAGRLQFLDAAQNTDFDIRIASAPNSTPGASPIALQGGGRWEGNRFEIEGNAQSPLALRDREAPYRIDLRARAGDTRAHARGTLLDPLRLQGFDLQFALRGDTLADLYPLLGLSLPPTPPYRLDGRLRRAGTSWRYDGFTGTVGDSDLAGSARVETGRARPLLQADLTSTRLDFDDLAGFVGGTPRQGDAPATATRTNGRVLPDRPYRPDKLRAMDADVRLRAKRVNAPRLPLGNMDAHLTLNDGVLVLDPLNFGVAGGNIRATIRMDARASTLRTQARIAARGLDLDRLLPDIERARKAVGLVGGEVALQGEGNSVAQMLATADGDVAIGMGRGQVSNLMIELAGLDVAEALKFLLTEDRRVPVRCAFGDFAVADGVMTARTFAFDTTDTIILGEGRIDLRNETLDLRLRPRPKDRSLFSFRSPLIVDGRFADPDIRPDMKRVGLRAALAIALGTIAPPAALLATLELGPGGNADCGGRYAR
ncbi:AsmA family protein [Cognatilysobacter bugurensis]|uniref:Membrane protein n=1 Tax=Cognatilysobacter bugurensis TaxID=543356 RepID=A0A918W7L4_9GAMM|nr:AsmA family protein [Lysobacter bugurensis]GHA77787.1 membrane protein [Lysobacter bugurensis]